MLFYVDWARLLAHQLNSVNMQSLRCLSVGLLAPIVNSEMFLREPVPSLCIDLNHAEVKRSTLASVSNRSDLDALVSIKPFYHKAGKTLETQTVA